MGDLHQGVSIKACQFLGIAGGEGGQVQVVEVEANDSAIAIALFLNLLAQGLHLGRVVVGRAQEGQIGGEGQGAIEVLGEPLSGEGVPSGEADGVGQAVQGFDGFGGGLIVEAEAG